MGREAGIATKPIRDDLDPKRGIVAWYNVAEPKLTYADEDGNTPAEATALIPIPDPDNPGGWLMKELWTTPENHKRYFGDTYKRLEGADSAGAYVVKEKKEWDDLLKQNRALEEENEELRKRPSGGSGGKTRRPYGTGTKRNDTAHIRAWLHANGYEVAVRGRIPTADMDKFNEVTGGKYEPSADEWKAWEALKNANGGGDGTEDTEPPFDGDHASESESEALSRVRGIAAAPEEDEEELSDDDMRNLLREAKEPAKARMPLTEAQRQRAVELYETKVASNA